MSLFKYNLQPRTKNTYELTLPSFYFNITLPSVTILKKNLTKKKPIKIYKIKTLK